MDWSKSATRLFDLRKEKDLSLQQLTDTLNKKYLPITFSKTGVQNYENIGSVSGMNIGRLMCLSDFYNVSVEYLLGISNCRNISADEVIEKIGLSEKSIQYLITCKQRNDPNDPFLHGLNYLLENEANNASNHILSLIINYLSAGSENDSTFYINEDGIHLRNPKPLPCTVKANNRPTPKSHKNSKSTDTHKTSRPTIISKKYYNWFNGEALLSSLYFDELYEMLKKERKAYQKSNIYLKFYRAVTNHKELEIQRIISRYSTQLLNHFDKNNK